MIETQATTARNQPETRAVEIGDTNFPETSHSVKMSEHRQKKTAELISILRSSSKELDRAIENIRKVTRLLDSYQIQSPLAETLEKAKLESHKAKSTLEEISIYLQRELDIQGR